MRYADTDQMGVVHHARWLEYFECGRSAWLRARGLNYAELEAAGTLLVVARLQVHYHRPARYDEVLQIETRLAEARGASVAFRYRAWRQRTLLAEASTLLVAVDRTGRPRRLPAALRELLAAEQATPAGRGPAGEAGQDGRAAG
ncbi:MAG: thioesterase [Planctomycetota bacterium]|nr:MAG: thioesterase [Planctomycetota bacterium]